MTLTTVKQSLNGEAEFKLKRKTNKKIFRGAIWTWRVPIDGQHTTTVVTKNYIKLRYYNIVYLASSRSDL